MNRGYSREAYLDLVDHVREVVPGVALHGVLVNSLNSELLHDLAHNINMFVQPAQVQFTCYLHKLYEFFYSQVTIIQQVKQLHNTAGFSRFSYNSVSEFLHNPTIQTQKLNHNMRWCS